MTAELDRAVLRHALGLLEPLGALGDIDDMVSLLDTAGWNSGALGLSPTALAGPIGSFSAALSAAAEIAKRPSVDLAVVAETLASLGAACANLVSVLSSAQGAAGVPSNALGQLAGDLTTLLVEHHVASRFPKVALIASLLGFLKPVPMAQIVRADGVELRRQGTQLILDLAALGSALRDPLGYVRKEFLLDPQGGARAAQDIADLVGPLVADGLVGAGMTAGYGIVPVEPGLTLTAAETSVASHLLLADARLPKTAQGITAIWRVAVGFTDDTNQQGVGLLLGTSGEVAISRTLAGGTVALTFKGAMQPLIITSKSVTLASGSTSTATFEAQVTYQSDLTKPPAVRLGSQGTRFEVKEIDLLVGVVTDGSTVDVQGTVDLKGILLALQGGDGDGFLSKVLPTDPIELRGDLGLDLSLRKGIVARGGASLEWRLGVGHSIGPLEISETRASVKVSDAAAAGELTTVLTLTLGPLKIVVDSMGLAARLVPASASGRTAGSVGPFDLAVAFIPPNGLGLSVDAGAVGGGGGFLLHDPDKGQYIGAIQLDLESFSVAAIGLLTTRLPDGSPMLGADGTPSFSLLLIIAMDFPEPIELGFGFALSGVGGLLGVNRTISTDRLKEGLRDGSVDSALLPTDVVANGPRIVANLAKYFPVAEGQYVVGPTADLIWGEKDVITARLGLFFEFPSPERIVLLGRLHLTLPTPQKPVIDIELDIAGGLDLTRKQLSLDARLRNSHVGPFALTGSAAMRMNYGDAPAFLVSVGGWNPRFQPPASFPPLERFALSLANSDNPRLRLNGYMAVTSNTFQVGAEFDLYASADLGIIGLFAVSASLGFDALFQIKPFLFTIDIFASVELTRNGDPFLAVHLKLHPLSGPAPWRAVGEVSFDFFGTHSIQFDHTFGTPPTLDPPETIDVEGDLRKALAQASNWHSLLPQTGRTFAKLRGGDSGNAQVVVHPLGALQVKQQVAPLELTITRFGSTKLPSPVHFSITSTSLTGVSDFAPVRDHFAPAQFVELTEDEKLSRPSFELLPAGVQFGSGAWKSPADTSWRSQDVQLETIILPPLGVVSQVRPKRQDVLPETMLLAQLAGAAVAQIGPISQGKAVYAAPSMGIGLASATYAVADRRTLTPVSTTQSGNLTFIPTYSDANEQRLAAPGASDPKTLQIVETTEVFAPTVTGLSGVVDPLQWFAIVAKSSGKCLTVANDRLDNGAPIQQSQWVDRPNQYWWVVPCGPGTYKIVAEHSQRVLDVTAVALDNGTLIQQWQWTGGANQEWRFFQVEPGYYKIESVNSRRCLGVAGGPSATGDGASIEQWDWYAGENQKWSLVAVSWRDVIRERIQELAFSDYERRGRGLWHAEDDWLAAQAAIISSVVALRAYVLYQRRGNLPGTPLGDWLEAERQVIAEIMGG